MFIGLIVVPITFYLYLAHPAWAWMYLVDPEGIPGFAILPIVVTHAAMVVLGWYVGARLIRSSKHKIVGYAASGGAALLLLAVILAWGRIGQYGTFAEFHDGRSLPLMEVKLGYVLVALVIAVAASAIYTAVELLRDSRRAVSR